ncbi:MAG: polyribonucleotide nucleotidyltransferase, partial [Planctomycetes bacterium]|nr:polyribonucleotide nucleotidyltransferase [Planctomycetota bacterium]
MQPTAHTTTVKIAGTEITFETGRIARQAAGAVLARCGDNVVLATVTAASQPKPGQDFFPLTVEYREKFAGAGKIPGAFGKREGRITDHEVLVCRLIDRSVRSLFPEHYKNDVQLQVQVLSCEPSSDLESLALLTACCALHISPVPANGPIAGLRVWRIDDHWQAFVGRDKAADADLEFSVAVGPEGLVMLEGEAREIDERDALAAIAQASEWITRCHKAFDELAAKTGRTKLPVPAAPELPEVPEATREALDAALAVEVKADRRAAIAAAEAAWLEQLDDDARANAKQAFGDAVWERMRENVLATGKRLDGRGKADVRPIWSEVGLLPRAHGSALFTRGETQAIVTCTLGSPDDALRQGNLADDNDRRSFFLHYNFPPYSVGEIRPLRGPGRREIGHGSLARRGLQPLIPATAQFPFTIRIESEITESNGSSSMATVCGGSMAMMHAGVPIERPIAGIAMGLISDGQRHAVLSDILGDEDHLGDMD